MSGLFFGSDLNFPGLTLSLPLEAEFDLSNFNVVYLKFYLYYLCCIFALFIFYILRTLSLSIKAIDKELPEL
jgi:hypothetical protein